MDNIKRVALIGGTEEDKKFVATLIKVVYYNTYVSEDTSIDEMFASNLLDEIPLAVYIARSQEEYNLIKMARGTILAIGYGFRGTADYELDRENLITSIKNWYEK